ncbi:hypothetical protein SAMN04488515_3191 [Cognatiyoonia koreensis]|uniref:Uncharacterized protein n=1 Tax=Cognatiyoonia koreensis TaxID=364200 RepID=A0A1I0RT01_9RHOB|nr:hypothetical protein SAMN04488515_3191 [Cognatiyoonia koreensis]
MDEFSTHSPGLTTPATRHYLIVPDDNADLAIRPRVIYCQVAGDIVVQDIHGTVLTYSLLAGDQLSLRGVRVLSTGTSGTFYGWS